MNECVVKICGETKTVPTGTTIASLIPSAADAPSRDKKFFAAVVNGNPKDLSGTISEDAEITLLDFDSPEGKEVYRHSSSHLMAQAVKEVFPTAQMTIGPAIDDGFYYDFDFERPFTPEDLQKIEDQMRDIIKRDLSVSRMELSREEAIRLFKDRGEPYKVELVEGIENPPISAYKQGEFIDLCTGPHLPSTSFVGEVKLLTLAGAYWRGSEKNKMLQRIYGTSFPNKEQMDRHLQNLEEIKKRDHRKLGKELDLFSLCEEIGGGLVLWHPKGAIIRKTIEDFWREEHLKAGYEIVFTPHVAKLDLWKQSGHLDFYKESMYAPTEVEGVPYQIKPMNCPFHIMIYKSRLRSYRELPFRWAELGSVYRYERSGTLHGLLRVRGFTQDDSHLFCRPDQIQDEILKVLDFTTMILKTFGFIDYDVYLSTRPEKYVGTLDHWEMATTALEGALKEKGLAYKVDPGEGVFYGPKIDMKIKDVLGRSWQCTTIQVDFNLPERFDLTYRDEDSKDQRPIMIHRALLGSIERFFGILIEHYAGAFPTWLAPVQVKILPITEAQREYADGVKSALMEKGIRCEADYRKETIGSRIRDAQLIKVPYMVIMGKKEVAEQTISVRNRSGESITIPLSDFMKQIEKELIVR
ncbi:MAG: threonine--tRNA ligase [Nitrospirota bacterium]